MPYLIKYTRSNLPIALALGAGCQNQVEKFDLFLYRIFLSASRAAC